MSAKLKELQVGSLVHPDMLQSCTLHATNSHDASVGINSSA
jgi:hypothetical protein